MRDIVRPALVLLVLLSLLCGVAYPLAVTGVAQTVMPGPANGSLIEQDGRVVGSALIGQPFAGPRYFWSRPSATSPAYNAAASSGSNLGPTNPALLEAVAGRVSALQAAGAPPATGVPIDLVTSSGSGLDPHISPAAAHYQVARVAAVRGAEPAQVRRLVDGHIEPRTLGILGEPRVHVLELNLALDRLLP